MSEPPHLELHVLNGGNTEAREACVRVLGFLLSPSVGAVAAEDVQRARHFFDVAVAEYSMRSSSRRTRRRRNHETHVNHNPENHMHHIPNLPCEDYMRDFYEESPPSNRRWNSLTAEEKKEVLDREAEMFARSTDSLSIRLALAARLHEVAPHLAQT